MIPLTDGQIGMAYQVRNNPKIDQSDKHLRDLGFATGAEVHIISASKDAMIVLARGSRIALNRATAALIYIEPKQDRSDQDWTSLANTKVGHSGRVGAILGKGAVKRRLMDMGFTRGVIVRVRKVAPLGDPIQVSIRGYELSLRKSEAQLILVEEASHD
ncbi:FeoA family protein [Agrilactobacillus fermenti]|uniref:FeoA family protein n=1 Tax=Agrilactobacillus fermenti TaxID=2586909 RepID=UPI001E2E585E|nr:ferrous iron transport protein A [Agrilactobacillus fermenti]MCD2256138.1 ferrous iron transport protein A [Agrilactobacillus fermenti]